ncbi:hypothetical protein BKA81DRAFT_351258 [Phyllosticta paracitricarpa]
MVYRNMIFPCFLSNYPSPSSIGQDARSPQKNVVAAADLKTQHHHTTTRSTPDPRLISPSSRCSCSRRCQAYQLSRRSPSSAAPKQASTTPAPCFASAAPRRPRHIFVTSLAADPRMSGWRA